jgi:hypothetical protein
VEEDVVRVTTAFAEPEAEAFCQLLRQNGIKCAHRPTPEIDSPFENFSGDGMREIVVAPADLQRARELLEPDSEVEPDSE